jgi:recombination protein RecA
LLIVLKHGKIKKNQTTGVFMSQNTDKRQALENAIAHIQKHFGQGAIMTLGKHSSNRGISTIKTGAVSLDLALGIGGVPRGRVVEIYGPESSGKTTLATHIVANAQKAGGIVAYIDAEHALDPSYAQRIGVDVNNLMICQPDCGEEALNIADMLARSNAVDVIVIDSVAALVPKSELEGEVGDSHMGLQARMMSQALRKLTSTLAKSNTCAIFINQIREKIGVMFGNPETTTGGRALKFYSSVRLDIRRIATIKGSDNTEIGLQAKVKVVKNKLAPPFKTAIVDIMFNKGISKEASLIDIAVDLEIIDKKGSWFSFKDQKIGQGREAVKKELRDKPKLAEQIEKEIYQKVQNQEAGSPEKAVTK